VIFASETAQGIVSLQFLGLCYLGPRPTDKVRNHSFLSVSQGWTPNRRPGGNCNFDVLSSSMHNLWISSTLPRHPGTQAPRHSTLPDCTPANFEIDFSVGRYGTVRAWWWLRPGTSRYMDTYQAVSKEKHGVDWLIQNPITVRFCTSYRIGPGYRYILRYYWWEGVAIYLPARILGLESGWSERRSGVWDVPVL